MYHKLQHIIEWHPELEGLQKGVSDKIRKGRRRQDPINPQKYKYAYPVEGLPFGLTHIVVIVRIATRKFVLTPIRKISRPTITEIGLHPRHQGIRASYRYALEWSTRGCWEFEQIGFSRASQRVLAVSKISDRG